MSIASSFYSALSGMNSNGVAMQVVADNISNSNTVGFKSSTVQFEDILGMSLEGIGGVSHLGVGANVSTMAASFIQGTLNTTGLGTDLAVNGKGFFIVENATAEEQFYTRAGNFHVDSDGYLVNPNGLRVQGYLYDSQGTNLVETLEDIVVDQTTMISPDTTSEVDMVLNLNSAEGTKTFDITDPGTTSNYSTALTVYDTLGQSHTITVYFSKTAAQTWDWNSVIDGSDVNGGVAGVGQLFGTGEIVFDTSGLPPPCRRASTREASPMPTGSRPHPQTLTLRIRRSSGRPPSSRASTRMDMPRGPSRGSILLRREISWGTTPTER
jgi:flagellar hook protein FlgE